MAVPTSGAVEDHLYNSLAERYQAGLQNAVTIGTGVFAPRTQNPRIWNTNTGPVPGSLLTAESIVFGTLYNHYGQPLADDWRGAYIDKVGRRLSGADTSPRWVYTFTSKWSNDAIALHLDAQEMSGKEADAVAETYREALNQRRVG